MRKFILGFLLVLPIAFLAAAANDKLSAVIKNAKYVFVTTPYGTPPNPNIALEDRHALSDVQDAIEKSGVLKLVYKQSEADVVIVVHCGRHGEVNAGVQFGTSPDRPRGSSESVGFEKDDPRDTFDVFDVPAAPSKVPLWEGRSEGGLKSPDLRLWREFREKLEAARKGK